MRELVRSVATRKRLIAVVERDPAHGGLSEAEARQHLHDSGAKYDAWGFDTATQPSPPALEEALLGLPDAGRPPPRTARVRATDSKPVVYERVGAFQQTMLRLIVQRLVPERELYLPGELGSGRRPSLARRSQLKVAELR